MAIRLGELEISDEIQVVSVLALIIVVVEISEPAVTALIGFFAVIGLIQSEYRQGIGAALIGGFVLNILIGEALLPGFASIYSDLPEVFASARLAGLVEPLTTKATPAIAILLYYRNNSPELVNRIQERPLYWGAILGWTIGFLEMLMKIPAAIPIYSEVNSVTFVVLFTTLLHLITGLLTAGSIFYYFERELDGGRYAGVVRGVKVALPVVVAMAFHYWWNAGGGQILYNFAGLPS